MNAVRTLYLSWVHEKIQYVALFDENDYKDLKHRITHQPVPVATYEQEQFNNSLDVYRELSPLFRPTPEPIRSSRVVRLRSGSVFFEVFRGRSKDRVKSPYTSLNQLAEWLKGC